MSDILADGFGMKDPDDDESFQRLIDDVKRINVALRRGANIAQGGALPTAVPVGGPFSPDSIARGGGLRANQNLADLEDASEARDNLGLGTAATFSATDFLQVANNLSDLGSVLTALFNLTAITNSCNVVTAYTSATSSTHTWNAATRSAWILLRGAGGSGGRTSATNYSVGVGGTGFLECSGPGGGGEGESLLIYTSNITAASSTVVVGAGGSAVSTGTYTDGNAGAASTIDGIASTTYSAAGGEGGGTGGSGGSVGGRGGWAYLTNSFDDDTLVIRVPGQNGQRGTSYLEVTRNGSGVTTVITTYLRDGLGGGRSGSPGAGGNGTAGGTSTAGNNGACYIWERTS